MGRPAKYTDDERSKALDLAARVGVGEAARQTGIPKGTIGSWAHRGGTTMAPEEKIKLVAVAKMAWAERRAGLADELGLAGEKAVALLLERIESGSIGNRDLVAAVATLIDRAQLLGGDATARIELVGQEVEAEALGVVDELAARRAA